MRKFRMARHASASDLRDTPSGLSKMIKQASAQELTKLLPLNDAVEAAIGHRPHISTVIRWATKGVRGKVLASTLVGGRRMTTVNAVRDFVEVTPGKSPAIEAETLKQSTKQAEKDAAKLKSMVNRRKARI